MSLFTRILNRAKPAPAAAPVKPTQSVVASSRSMASSFGNFERWRESYNPLRGLDIRKAVSLAESYFRGEMADLEWTYFFIEQTDPDLLALIEMTMGRILEMDTR